MSLRSTGAAPAFTKKMRTPPPEETGAEASYLSQLREKQTPVTVKMLDGEQLRGWIEYYDLNMIRLTREDGPNLFIFKKEILYIADESGRRR